MSVGTIYYNLW